MGMQFRNMNYLPIKANSLKEAETVTPFCPENVALIGRNGNGFGARVFDLGRFCFTRRGSKKFNPDSDKFEVQVDPSSFIPERTFFIGEAILFLREDPGMVTNIFDKASKLSLFLAFTEDHNKFPQDINTALDAYQAFIEHLTHRSRLPKGTPGSISIRGATRYAQVARDFIGAACSLSQQEIERKVPTLKGGQDSSGTEPVTKSDRQDFVYVCLSIFEQFQEAILKRKPFPWVIDLSNAGIPKSFVWCGNTNKSSRYLDDFADGQGEIKSIQGLISELKATGGYRTKAEKYARVKALKSMHAKMSETNTDKERFQSSLYRSYDIAALCFWYCFLAATGLNYSVAANLNRGALDYTPQRGYIFSGLKVRAGNKIVHAEFQKKFEKYFKKFENLREWAISELDVEPPLYFFLFKDREFPSTKSGTSFNFHVREIIKDSCRIMPSGSAPLLKKLLKKHDVPIKVITSTQLRKGVSFDFYKLSGGDAALVAQKLGNSIATVEQAYSEASEEDAYPELSDYYSRVIEGVKKIGYSSSGAIPVRILEDDKEDNLPVGSCDNVEFVSPRKAEQFGEEVPDPDCARSETCLFCEYFALHADRSGLKKLLSFRELFPLIKERTGSIDRYIQVFSPIEGRIEEIIEHIQAAYPEKINLLGEISEEVSEGDLDEFWEHHFNFLIELGYAA